MSFSLAMCCIRTLLIDEGPARLVVPRRTGQFAAIVMHVVVRCFTPSICSTSMKWSFHGCTARQKLHDVERWRGRNREEFSEGYDDSSFAPFAWTTKCCEVISSHPTARNRGTRVDHVVTGVAGSLSQKGDRWDSRKRKGNNE